MIRATEKRKSVKGYNIMDLVSGGYTGKMKHEHRLKGSESETQGFLGRAFHVENGKCKGPGVHRAARSLVWLKVRTGGKRAHGSSHRPCSPSKGLGVKSITSDAIRNFKNKNF